VINTVISEDSPSAELSTPRCTMNASARRKGTHASTVP